MRGIRISGKRHSLPRPARGTKDYGRKQYVKKRIPEMAASIAVAGLMLGLGAGTASAAGTAGALDPAFGHGGIVVTNLGLDANGNQIQGNPSAAALQSDGDIVVAVGTSGPGAGLVRYLPNGARDSSFGSATARCRTSPGRPARRTRASRSRRRRRWR